MSKTKALRALIFDVDGTLAETERDGHRVAFNRAFAAQGLDWHWDVPTYGRWLRISGGRERIRAYIDTRDDAPVETSERDALAAALHRRKNRAYADVVEQGGISARRGVLRLPEASVNEGVRLAIATTTGRGNLDALFPRLFGKGWETRFDAIACAEDAPNKKPDPQVYHVALHRLGIDASEALAVEDSPAGLAAARHAHLACLVTRSAYFRRAAFPGAAAVVDDLDTAPDWPGARGPRIGLDALRALHATMRV